MAALAKTGDGGEEDEEENGGDGAGLPPARRAKVSINIFEDVDDRWVGYSCRHCRRRRRRRRSCCFVEQIFEVSKLLGGRGSGGLFCHNLRECFSTTVVT